MADPDPPPPPPELVVGLCGGIASGKSTVAGLFAAAGFEHIDADAIAREVVDRPAVRAALAARFGAGVLAADGSLDRAALAAVVFRDPAARRDLEALTHPPVRAAIEARLAAARRAGRAVLLDVPLLFETGWDARCDHVVFTDAPADLRRARARERGWDAAEWQRREAAQLPVALKRQRATSIIPTVGPIAATRDRVHELIRAWSTAP